VLADLCHRSPRATGGTNFKMASPGRGWNNIGSGQVQDQFAKDASTLNLQLNAPTFNSGDSLAVSTTNRPRRSRQAGQPASAGLHSSRGRACSFTTHPSRVAPPRGRRGVSAALMPIARGHNSRGAERVGSEKFRSRGFSFCRHNPTPVLVSLRGILFGDSLPPPVGDSPQGLARGEASPVPLAWFTSASASRRR
jgi:hypothetical protein